MLNALAGEQATVGDTFAEASAALGDDLWKIVVEGPADKLNQTVVTQPAMLAAGVAVFRVWEKLGGARPAVMAGHSLGEYTALVCAGAVGFADAVKLVADRGRFMQEAVPAGEGAMAAILGLEDSAVIALCDEAANGDVLSAVNFNSPGQVVIAGAAKAVERAIVLAKARGAKRALPLPVSVPSHCALMRPAAERLRRRLADVRIGVPAVPVIHNFHVQSENTGDGIREALVRQVESPVRWVETVKKLEAEGATRLLECGPGKVLAGLNRRIATTAETGSIFDPKSIAEALAR